MFIQLSGVPGSGKSTLAKAISQKIDVIIIDHDVTKTALLEQIDNQNLSQSIGQLSYHVDWKLIDFLLGQKKTIIFDSPCLYDEILEKGMSLSKKHNCSYKYIECFNENYAEIEERLNSRDSMLSQINRYESYDSFFNALINSKKPRQTHFMTVDTSKPIETYLANVMTYINKN